MCVSVHEHSFAIWALNPKLAVNTVLSLPSFSFFFSELLVPTSQSVCERINVNTNQYDYLRNSYERYVSFDRKASVRYSFMKL